MFDYQKMFDLSGKIALVVGGARGIGQSAAVALAAFGANVTCADLDADGCADTLSQISEAGGTGQAMSLDMRDADQIEQVMAQHPTLDILITTPSINVRKPMLETTPDEFDKVINLNLKGTFMLMTSAARRMVDSGGGSIIAFSSIRANLVEPGQAVYSATKSGTLQLVRGMASELAEQGVRVNAIGPGVVETPLTAQIKQSPDWYRAYADRNAQKRWAQPHEMAGAVVYLASDASSYVTGSIMYVDGGWTAIDGRFTPPL